MLHQLCTDCICDMRLYVTGENSFVHICVLLYNPTESLHYLTSETEQCLLGKSVQQASVVSSITQTSLADVLESFDAQWRSIGLLSISQATILPSEATKGGGSCT